MVSGIVQQFGFATIPVFSSARSPFTSGTTSGTPSCKRNADDLSTQSVPAATAAGTSSRLHCVPIEKKHTSRRASPSAPARGFLDLEWAELRARGAPRCERTDVRVSALEEVLERHTPDGAGRTNDPDAELRVDHRSSVRMGRYS